MSKKNLHKIISTFIFLVILLPGLSSLSLAQTRNLEFYTEKGINNNPSLNEQKNTKASAKLDKNLVTAQYYRPLVFGSAEYLYAPTFGNFGYDKAVTNSGLYAALFNVEYPLLAKKRVRILMEQAESSIDKALIQEKLITHEIKSAITEQYITGYQNQLELSYIQENIDLLNRQKNTLVKLAEQGLTNITDLKQLQLELQALKIQKKSLQSSFRNKISRLNSFSGIIDTQSVRLETPDITINSTFIETSRFINQFKIDSLKSAVQQKVDELKYLPSVSLYGNTGLNTTQINTLKNTLGFSAGIRFSVPLYDGNQKKITRQQNKLAIQSISAFKNQFEIERQNKLIDIQAQLHTLKNQLASFDNQIQEYDKLLQIYRKEVETGDRSIVDYLIVLRGYITSRNQRINLNTDRLLLLNEFNYWNW